MEAGKGLPRQYSTASSDGGGSGGPSRRVLGRQFEVLRRLGQGSFGVAYIVRDLKAGRDEEHKVLKEIFIGNRLADNGLDAVREAKLLSKLTHPNIVRYHSSFVQGEMFCIVTEYCDNGDLDMMIKRVKAEAKRFEEKLVVTYFVQLLMAVKYMHDRKLLHRDIKASNIFLRNNVIKLGDFGITRLLERTEDMASTFTGTPNYMSPEVVQHEGYNSKSDIWSLGCVLFEMCALRVAFKAANLLELMNLIVYKETPSLPDTYSKDLRLIFNLMMEKDTGQRASAVTVLKHRYIVAHVSSLKEQILSQQVAAEKDATEIAEALSGYSHSRKQRKKEVCSRAQATPDEPIGDSRTNTSHHHQDTAELQSPGVPSRSDAAPLTPKKTACGSKATKASSSSASKQTPQASKTKSRVLTKQTSDAKTCKPAAAAASPQRTPKKKVTKLPPKKMTPKERLQYRKRIKADAEAGRMKQEVGKQYAEQQEQLSRNRSRNTVKRPPPWVAENPDICETVTGLYIPSGPSPQSPRRPPPPIHADNDVVTDSDDAALSPDTIGPVSPLPSATAGDGQKGGEDQRTYISQFDFDELPVGGTSATSRNPSPGPPAQADMPAPAHPRHSSPYAAGNPDGRRHADDDFHFQTDGGHSIHITFDDITLDDDDDVATLTPRNVDPRRAGSRSGASGERAIAGSAGSGGVAGQHRADDVLGASYHYIPEDPDEADDLYTREDDFEVDSDDDDIEIDLPPGRSSNELDSESSRDDLLGCHADSHSSGAGAGVEDGGERDDLVALVDVMSEYLQATTIADGSVVVDQNDLSASRAVDPVVAHDDQDVDADPESLALGDPSQKIRQLKRGCIQLFGEEDFHRVYRFLLSARYGQKPLSDLEVRTGLAEIVTRVRDCFLVEQLIFLEHK